MAYVRFGARYQPDDIADVGSVRGVSGRASTGADPARSRFHQTFAVCGKRSATA